ncbi:hypothetical protein ColKHC_12568 [Colletotrichum higginsianum]|nr:hypothetical protein ColKHC_12568 [Colletotrichum higginsianum]
MVELREEAAAAETAVADAETRYMRAIEPREAAAAEEEEEENVWVPRFELRETKDAELSAPMPERLHKDDETYRVLLA